MLTRAEAEGSKDSKLCTSCLVGPFALRSQWSVSMSVGDAVASLTSPPLSSS